MVDMMLQATDMAMASGWDNGAMAVAMVSGCKRSRDVDDCCDESFELPTSKRLRPTLQQISSDFFYNPDIRTPGMEVDRWGGGCEAMDGEATVNVARIEALFARFADPNSGQMELCGVHMLCQQAFSNFTCSYEMAALLLGWYLCAKGLYCFEQEEFVSGLLRHRCDSLEQLRSLVVEAQKDIRDMRQFKLFFRHVFYMGKSPAKKFIMMNVTKHLLRVIIPSLGPHTFTYLQFLDQSPHECVNEDQWMSFLEFSKIIHLDCSNYDVDGAWPLLLDEYVEWFRQTRLSVL
eukprot:gnl/Hemi2/25340_TR8533_c0_g1_i1.p1 gnl/Hemi2/25340_TR8533_c0_g1~~gnl/Hemi2/25340_TR8533_c0_g1_i1.p1  ORF type:complete len:339 (-),score=48.47 gnl/Hemi2/25340_TR8533_c0_g1_i1:64-933(-)